MDLRRALTTAVAAAVLAPVVLVAAPAGYAAPGTPESGTASGDGTPSVPTSPPATGSATDPASATPSEGGTASPGDGSTAAPSGSPAPSGTGTAGPTPAPTPTDTTTPTPTPSATTQPTRPADVTATPSVLPTGTTSVPPSSGEPDRDSPNGVCDVAAFDVHIEDLPATVPAGSTTEPFTVVLDNSAGTDTAHVQFGLSLAFRDGLRDRDWLAAQQYVSVRYFDWQQDAWASDMSDGGIYTYADLEAGKRYEMRLRLVLAPDTPPGAAGALAFSTKWTFDGPPGSSACVHDNEWYRFEITASGTAPAAARVRPQGGRAPEVLRTEPREARPAEATFAEGALARTGSGPGLTLLVLASTATIALGAGAMVFAVRRRG